MEKSSKYTKQLKEMKKELEGEIDGGEECHGRDSQLSRWIETVDEAICAIDCLSEVIVNIGTEAQCE